MLATSTTKTKPLSPDNITTKTLRVGVIGAGAMGKNHVRVYSALPCARLVGICDLNAEAGKLIARRFNTKFYDNVAALLKDVDAVTVATPTVTHYNVVRQALEAGKHVLVEKPICADAISARKLCELARERGLTLAVGHIERHNPIVKFTKQALASQEYGDLISLSGKRVGGDVSDRIKDVGVIFDLGIHEIDICRYLVGSEVKSVHTFGGTHGDKTHMENYAIISLMFENGSCANIEINWLTPIKIRKLGLTCSKMFVELDYIKQQLKISSAHAKKYDVSDMSYLPWEYDTRKIPLKKQEPLKCELDDFLKAIIDMRRPLVTGEDGAAAVRIADAAVRSYKEGRIVNVGA